MFNCKLQGVQPHQATSTDHQWVWLHAIQGLWRDPHLLPPFSLLLFLFFPLARSFLSLPLPLPLSPSLSLPLSLPLSLSLSLSCLLIPTSYSSYLFTVPTLQEGIEPMWEDPKNRNGGRWLLNLDKKDRQSCLDNCWMETVQFWHILCCSFFMWMLFCSWCVW